MTSLPGRKIIVVSNSDASSEKRICQRSGFSLAELIVAIALLSVFGVIAARMFFVSDQLSEKTAQLDQAVILSANIAEAWKAVPASGSLPADESAALAGFRPADFAHNLQDGYSWQTELDTNLVPAAGDSGRFLLVTILNQTDIANVWQLEIRIESLDLTDSGNSSENKAPLYAIEASRYFWQEVPG